MTFEEWKSKTQHARDIAERVSASLVERMRETARQACLDPMCPSLHAHNALVGLKYGKPWPGVDYSLVRKVLWLEQRSLEPGRIAERYSRRLWGEVER